MLFFQEEFKLPHFSRGYHIITDYILKSMPQINTIALGQLHVFIKHTSASLTINENADPTVREDFENHLNVMIPENQSYYKHTFEGSDDMPAHIKASMIGNSLNIPITNGNLNLGIWQGIYLCEHRNNGGRRHLVITAFGK